TGIGLGGNKVRKLEFLLADAKNKGAEIVFTTGGAQSNHAMLTAACCKKLGMTPILILKKRGVTDRKGNILLEYLMNTDVRFLDTGDSADVYREMDRVGQESGKVYYKIPTGGSNALGALGYVNCVKEISEQTDIKFDYICCAEGSGGTHAGVAMGAKLFMPNTKVIGMMVDTDPFEEITTNIMKGLAELLELDFVPTVDDVHLVDVCGAGYAIPSPEGNAAIRMMAENEGLFLDPVYTGKAFGGLIQMAREGKFGPDDNILYLYSGGAGGLFAIDVSLD
ncbi:MAG: pyridoxal-phosphate dependent enzyme, partial [Firmicutes bacterium]|nr:pyridoxal-phosphate dependent enzyme [Bacillota bacterium]